ncbi:MAG: N-acetylglucosamine-6-phosphate deacetylase [Ramlibacter sp.]|nr:N-acetylglucosamine-6-phosphate deacetylase [Ramlibacter sp.]
MTSPLRGHILTPTGFVTGALEFDLDGRISRIEGNAVDEAQARDSQLPLILPGFIDLHVHGGGGHDVMQGADAALHVARTHASHGTTSLVATTMTAPFDDLKRAFEGLRDCTAVRPTDSARILGVHLEGPYINAGKLGAQPDFARPVSLEELALLNAIAPIRIITLAPEVAGNLAQIGALVAAGYRVQIGHTLGSYEQGVEALAHGAHGFTHLFNAMTPLNHRLPGMVGAALAHAQYAEIIPDLLHVHPGATRGAMRAIPRLYCVTDSTAATGMPDGDYQLGRQTVTKCLGGGRLADGKLAGSALTMDQALRNLVDKMGLGLRDASLRLSTHAADFLGLDDRGRLVSGAWADAVVFDRDLKVRRVFVEGQAIGRMHDPDA